MNTTSPPSNPDAWRATGLEAPVFADPKGRRARVMRGVGFGIASATATALGLVVTGALGFSNVPPLAATTHAAGLQDTRTSLVRAAADRNVTRPVATLSTVGRGDRATTRAPRPRPDRDGT
jgi:hypothetical protein